MKTIQFKSIDITNYMSVGKTQHVDFTDGICAIFGINHDKDNDSNGCGKSVLLSAISFALYGDPVKDVKREEVVNRIADGKCEVVLDFDVVENGKTTECRIERGVKPSFCRLFVDGKDESLSGMNETTKRICDIVSATSTMFKNTCLMSLEDNVPFARQKAAEKREFIEGVFDLGFIREMGKMAKVEADKYASENTAAGIRVEEHRRQIELYTKSEKEFEEERVLKIRDDSKHIDQVKERIEFWRRTIPEGDLYGDSIKSISSNIERLNGEISSLEDDNADKTSKMTSVSSAGAALKTKIEHAKSAIEEHKTEFDKIVEFARSFGVDDDVEKYIEENTEEMFNARIKESRDIVTDGVAKLAELKAKMSLAKTDIDNLMANGDVCLACGRPFPESDLAKRDVKVAKLRNELVEMDKSVLVYRKTVLKQEDVIKAFEREKNNMIVLRGKLEHYKSFVEEDVDVMEKAVVALRAKYSNLSSSIKANTASIKEKKEEVSKLTSELMSVREKAAAVESAKQHVESLGKEVQLLTESMEKVRTQENKFTKYRKDSEKALSEQEAICDSTEHMCDVYRSVRDILSDDGFRSYMVKQYVSALNSRINEYLNELDSPIQLEFDEFLDDKITDQLTGKTCSYGSLSGGEKRRVDIACLLAFSDLRKLRGDVAFSHAFYDEILDSALSPGACAKLMGILKERYDDAGESAMVITHKKEMQDDPNIVRRIIVEKLGGVTKFTDG